MEHIFSLSEQIVIVTGGAGYLGKAISSAMANAGAKVYVTGRNVEKLAELEKLNTAWERPRIFVNQLDVTNEKGFKDFAAEIYRKENRIDCLVNNANAAGREKWEALDLEKWNAGLKGSLQHYFTSTKVVSEYLLKDNRGCIINNASLFAFLAPNFPMHLDLDNAASAHHVAAKGGILQLTRYLATLWAPKGIRVNSVSPGYFPQKRGPERLDYMHEVQMRIPMKRIGKPEEVAGAFVFLASKSASYITGQNIVIDGGYSVW